MDITAARASPDLQIQEIVLFHLLATGPYSIFKNNFDVPS